MKLSDIGRANKLAKKIDICTILNNMLEYNSGLKEVNNLSGDEERKLTDFLDVLTFEERRQFYYLLLQFSENIQKNFFEELEKI